MSRSSYSAKRQPFIHLTTALVAGIVLDRQAEPAVWVLACGAIAATAIAAGAFLSRKDGAATLALLLAIATAGALLAYAERTGIDETRLKRLFAGERFTADDPLHLTGSLAVPPEPAPGAFYLDVSAESILLRGQVIRATGGVRLLVAVEAPLSRDEFDRLRLDYGSRVRMLVRLERARSYRNPGSPDFNEFLERGGFDLTGVVKSPLLIERLDEGPAPSMLGWLYRARLRWMDAIDARFRPDVAGTLKAMLLGNRYFLDPESADRLRESSTFHIISISGMHVGLIAWAMLGGWTPSKRRRTLHVALALSGLWLYALMVGLQPPVTRATVMITAGLFAPIIFRRAASVNTVALAAFLMLAQKPSLVADPGFQLSFIAVTAIVAIAAPLSDRLRQTGAWIPAAKTPHPPFCSGSMKALAECLFWNERRFRAEMRRGTARYNLDKAPAARSLPIRLLQPVLRWTVILAVTSTSIQIATLPLSVLYFNRIAPVGVLINLISGIMAGVLMLGAVAAFVLDPVTPWLASQVESLVAFAHHLLIHAAGPFTAIPGASFRAPHFDDWRAAIYIVYFALVVAMAVLIDRWRPVHQVEPGDKTASFSAARSFIHLFRVAIRPRQAAAACTLGLFICSVTVARPAAPAATEKLTVHFLDVGQGDSALVVFPQGATMLIDAGGEIRFDRSLEEDTGETEGSKADSANNSSRSFVGEMVVSRFLWSLGLTRIDYVLVTHPDRDHIGGFSEVLRNFRIGQAVIADARFDNEEAGSFAASVLKRAIPAAVVSAGDRYEIQGVTVEVLWPPAISEADGSGNNNRSIVIRLVYGEVAILLTGDIELAAEDALLKSGRELRANLLKVPHHGSKTSSGEALLDAVRPGYAVVSVGEQSRFGHPHESVVARYTARAIKLYRTGRDGMVSAVTDGASLEITTYRR